MTNTPSEPEVVEPAESSEAGADPDFSNPGAVADLLTEGMASAYAQGRAVLDGADDSSTDEDESDPQSVELPEAFEDFDDDAEDDEEPDYDSLDDDEEGEFTDEDDEADDEDDDPESDASQSEPENLTEADIQRFGQLLFERPDSWSEIPAKQRAAAIQRLGAGMYQQGVRDAATHIQQQQQGIDAARELVGRVDAMIADDPDQYAEWSQANPGELAQYGQAKAYFSASQNGAPPPASFTPPAAQAPQQPQQDFNGLAQAQLQRLFADDVTVDAREEIFAKVRAGEYLQTAEGIQSLSGDIDKAISATARRQQSAEADAERRTKAQRRRRRTARTRRGGTSGETVEGAANPLANVTDPRELFDAGFDNVNRRARKGALPRAAR